MSSSKSSSLLRIGFWLFLGVGVACTGAGVRHAGAFSRSGSDVTVSTSAKEGREIVFDDFWATINDRYYDGRFNGVDWNGIRDTYRERAVAAGTTEEFYSVLREMVGLLHDVHTRVFAPGENADWRQPRYIGVGISTREIDGALAVVSVDSHSEAEAAGVKVGDLIQSVDNTPVSVSALGTLKTPLSRQRAAISVKRNPFDGMPGSTALVTWKDRDGKPRSASLHRQWKTRTPVLQISNIRNGLSVVTFDAFTEEIAVQFQKSMEKQLKSRKGLILDLRNNGGGETEALVAIASMFLPSGADLGRFYNREGGMAADLRTSTVNTLSSKAVPVFSGPLVILASNRTASAAEIFTREMQARHRATVVGESSCGCVLAIRTTHTLPDGGTLDVSEYDYRTAENERLEGRGITPDESRLLRLEDLRTGTDQAMAEAKRILGSR